MASIMIRDLTASETMERQASLHVKGGWSGGYLKHRMKRHPLSIYPVPMSIDRKLTGQFQSAQVNNTAVGIKGPGAFQLEGAIAQSQSA